MWRLVYFVLAFLICFNRVGFKFDLNLFVMFLIGFLVVFALEFASIKKRLSKMLILGVLAATATGGIFILTLVVMKSLQVESIKNINLLMLILFLEGYIVFSVSLSIWRYIYNYINLGKPDSIKNSKILDTSVIVDGRVYDIAEKNFFDGVLVLPEFVIKEVQFLSDSKDPQKRIRGRRALEILNKMKSSKNIVLSVTDIDFPHIKEVDLKLIELAKKMSSKVITNDFNLMKVASIHGVQILNINDLANSLHVVVIPGETIKVDLIREGKEKQALAYLEDGTMIVVENAKHLIGKNVEVEIDTVLPKEAGRVIFAFLAGSRQNSRKKLKP